MSLHREARIYVVLKLKPLREGIGDAQLITLTREEMERPSAEVVQARLGVNANLADWEVKMSIVSFEDDDGISAAVEENY